MEPKKTVVELILVPKWTPKWNPKKNEHWTKNGTEIGIASGEQKWGWKMQIL